MPFPTFHKSDLHHTLNCHTALSCAHQLPEGRGTAILSTHATEIEMTDSHGHSSLITDVRIMCTPMVGDCPPGCARHVRGPRAAASTAGHALRARVVSGSAQLMCATCADATGDGCELTFARLTCENSAGKHPSGAYAVLIASLHGQRTPPVKGYSKSD